jgi:hypothetical protein
MFAPLGDSADLMLVIIMAGPGVAALLPSPWLRTADYWLVAGEVCLAYFFSGMTKLRMASWRAGRQVALILNSQRYGSPLIS